MPVYNGEMYLQEAVESILGQTFQDFELLVINDGSADNTAVLLEGYCDHRIRVVHNHGNQGLITTLNKGLELAEGRYIARMDADDSSHPARLERQFLFMEQHPEIAVCGAWLSIIEGQRVRSVRFPLTPDQQRCGLLFDSTIPHPCAMLRRSTLTAHNLSYCPAAQYAEDYDLWVRLSQVGQLVCLPEELLTYRRHTGQISQRKQDEQRAAAGKIRLAALSGYGVKLTDEEFCAHQALGTGLGDNSRRFWKMVDAWIVRLLTENQAQGWFEQELLARVVAERWLALLKKELQRAHYSGLVQYPAFIRSLPGGVGFLAVRLREMYAGRG